MTVNHVVVDGSNLATEGHTLPSLQQLDDAVRAYIAEFAPKTVTVVVDASFPNRIDESERASFEEALTEGELITPPAGVIGRGDAFLLQIADRAARYYAPAVHSLAALSLVVWLLIGVGLHQAILVAGQPSQGLQAQGVHGFGDVQGVHDRAHRS